MSTFNRSVVYGQTRDKRLHANVSKAALLRLTLLIYVRGETNYTTVNMLHGEVLFIQIMVAKHYKCQVLITFKW